MRGNGSGNGTRHVNVTVNGNGTVNIRQYTQLLPDHAYTFVRTCYLLHLSVRILLGRMAFPLPPNNYFLVDLWPCFLCGQVLWLFLLIKKLLGVLQLLNKHQNLFRIIYLLDSVVYQFYEKIVKGLLQIYLLIPQREHCSGRLNFSFELLLGHACIERVTGVYCFFSWLASLFSSVQQIFWLIVVTRTCMSVRSVVLTRIFTFGVRTPPIRYFFSITHILFDLRFFEFVSTPPLSVFGYAQCFKLRHTLSSAFRNAWCSWDTAPWTLVFADAPLMTLQVSLILQISCSCRDQIFWSWLLFKNVEG